MNEFIEEIENIQPLNFDEYNCDENNHWKSVLYFLKINEKKLEDIKKSRDEVIYHYNESIREKQSLIDNIKNHISEKLPQCTQYRTKTGGFTFDLYPHIGSISLSKEKESIDISDDYYEKFIEMGFYNTITKFSKSKFNESYTTKNGKVIDTNTGEEIEPENMGIKIIKNRTLTIK